MKRIRPILSLLLCLCLLSLCTGTAFAVDLSRKTAVLNKMPHCTITGFESNRYIPDRPVIIFFLGSQECFSWLNGLTFIRDQKIFEDLDVDVLFLTMPKAELWYKLWEAADEDLYDFLRDKYEAAHFPIILDCVSFGGYGGCYLADLLRENGITVQELNLADACNSNCVYADQVQNIALAGTRVNIWGTKGSQNISKNTREVIEELDGTENVRTVILDCRHAKALTMAINEYGLHSNLPKSKDE